ncbi:MAG: FtsW/RodA/SpoVE family cell cycle protein [Leptospiraceae bacterium]|nr:FtsW/RodA/SpoVE family cell cycle protein [Leptospiraceae bacterium]MCP5499576.1 FtsW/RodA/SpoVE family cell cycle protein [Leptospiraceae bacterium]
MNKTNSRLSSFLSPGKYEVDLPLLYSIFILLFLGLGIMFSGSSITASREFQDPMYFAKKQAAWTVLSIFGFILIANIDYRYYKRYASQLILLSLFLLVLVFIPGLGKSVHTYYGRSFHRWIGIGSFQLQPSEFAKIAIVTYLAAFLVKMNETVHRTYRNYILPGFLVLSVIALIIIEPAFGTTLEIISMIIALIFIDGFPIRKLLFGFISSIPLLMILIYKVGYRKKRIEVWLDPYKYRYDEGHQLVSSFRAFNDGGWFGTNVSTGYSHRYLTYSHTDFVMATYVEDFGYIGFLFLFFLFIFLILRSFMLIRRVNEPFGFLLGVGIISMIGVQILINLFVVTGVFPITGISLPFVSYGGSSLLTVMLSLGILCNITRKENLQV